MLEAAALQVQVAHVGAVQSAFADLANLEIQRLAQLSGGFGIGSRHVAHAYGFATTAGPVRTSVASASVPSDCNYLNTRANLTSIRVLLYISAAIDASARSSCCTCGRLVRLLSRTRDMQLDHASTPPTLCALHAMRGFFESKRSRRIQAHACACHLRVGREQGAAGAAGAADPTPQSFVLSRLHTQPQITETLASSSRCHKDPPAVTETSQLITPQCIMAAMASAVAVHMRSAGSRHRPDL